MNVFRRRGWWAACLLLSALCARFDTPSARAADNGGPQAVWETFRSCLRRGDYRAAYGYFSPASRQVFAWEDFSREYDPVGVATPLILAEPVSSRMQKPFEDWAELHFAVRRGDGGAAKLRVALVREDGVWRLVAGRRETMERWELETRHWLAAAAAAHDDPRERHHWLETRRAEAGTGPSFYRTERVGDGIRAAPRREGLREFLLAPDGTVTDPADAPRPAPVFAAPPSATPTAPATVAPGAPATPTPRPSALPIPTVVGLPGTGSLFADASASSAFGVAVPAAMAAPASPLFETPPGTATAAVAAIPAAPAAGRAGAPTFAEALGLSAEPSGAVETVAGAFPAATRRREVATLNNGR